MVDSVDYFGYYEREFNVCVSFERGRLAMDSDGLIVEDCPNRVVIESVHEIKSGKWVEMPIEILFFVFLIMAGATFVFGLFKR